MKTLITKGLVMKSSCPAKYSTSFILQFRECLLLRSAYLVLSFIGLWPSECWMTILHCTPICNFSAHIYLND